MLYSLLPRILVRTIGSGNHKWLQSVGVGGNREAMGMLVNGRIPWGGVNSINLAANE